MQIDGQANIPNKVSSAASAPGIDVEALHAEVAKWQERVPKLAAALRERTEELASVRQDLREAQKAGPDHAPYDGESDDARLQARDQLIGELQQKVTDLTGLHRTAASELHVTQLDLSTATEEAKGWQDKWQQVTASLDNSVANASRSSSDWQQAKQQLLEQEQTLLAAHAKEMERARRDTESLRVRNANLQETTEFANKQIESLGEDVALLVEQGKTTSESLAAADKKLEELSGDESGLQQRIVTAERDVASRQNKLNENAEELQSMRADNATQAEQITKLKLLVGKSDEELVEQADKFEQRLTDEDGRYAAAMLAADEEQTQLARQLDAKDEAATGIKDELDAQQLAHTKQAEELQSMRTALDNASRELEESSALTKAKNGQVKVLESEQQKLNQALVDAEQRLSQTEQNYAQDSKDKQSLVQRVDSLREQLDAAKAANGLANEQAAEQIHGLNNALEDAQVHSAKTESSQTEQIAELEKLQQEQRRWQDREEGLVTQLDELSAASTEKEQDLQSEINRLNKCVSQAQDSNSQREDERRELTDKVGTLESRNAKLKAGLEERAQLVRSLEDERAQAATSHSEADTEHTLMQSQLVEARNRIETFQEHAESLDSKRVTQQGLMSDLEAELSEVHEQTSAALKGAEQARRDAVGEMRELSEQLNKLQAELQDSAEAHGQEIAVLQAQIGEYETKAGAANTENSSKAKGQLQEMEQLLRERTEELDTLRWRQEQQQATADDNLVMVLNQQLTDAREENKRLSDKLANVSSVVVSSAPVKDAKADDLTMLKGIGAKLAERLAELGVTRYQQIADLNPKDLAQKDHVLHAFRSRLTRDSWIKQAKKAISS